MARKNALDNLDNVTKNASLAEQRKKEEEENGKQKAKLIHIDESWEKLIKRYQGGTVSAYIRMAIREKMKRDGIL